jgi:hypothetical protein
LSFGRNGTKSLSDGWRDARGIFNIFGRLKKYKKLHINA